nr:zinc-binding dehydrogenase [Propionicicella superfundia]
MPTSTPCAALARGRPWQGAARVGDRDPDLGTLPAGVYDAAIDLGGRASLRALQRLVRDDGVVVGVSGGTNRVLGPLGRMARASILPLGSSRQLRSLAAVATPSITTRLLALADAGDLAGVVDRVFPFDRASEAFAYLDAGGVVGKVLVTAGE